MKVIFLQDVPRVGRKYEVKNIASGYARNYLVPKRLASIATKSNEKKIAQIIDREKMKKGEREKGLHETLDKIKGKEIVFIQKVSEAGSLFAGIGQDEIAEKLSSELDVIIDRENINLEKPIKETGEFAVSVGTKDNSVEIALKVQAE